LARGVAPTIRPGEPWECPYRNKQRKSDSPLKNPSWLSVRLMSVLMSLQNQSQSESILKVGNARRTREKRKHIVSSEFCCAHLISQAPETRYGPDKAANRDHNLRQCLRRFLLRSFVRYRFLQVDFRARVIVWCFWCLWGELVFLRTTFADIVFVNRVALGDALTSLQNSVNTPSSM